MWIFLILFIISILAVRKNFYYNNKRNGKILERKVPEIPFIPLLWSVITGPHVEIMKDIPYEYYQAGIYKARLGPHDYYTIINADYARKILTEPDEEVPKFEYSSELPVLEFYGTGIVFANGDKWRTHRKLSNPAFNRALSPNVMGDVVLETFRYLQNEIHEPIDIYETLQRITIEVLGQAAFGYSFGTLKSKELPDIVRKYKIILNHIETYSLYVFPFLNKLPTKKNRIFREAIKDFDKFIFEIIDLKKIELSKRKKLNEKNNHDINDDGDDNNNKKNEELLVSMLEAIEQENIDIGPKDLRDNMINFFSAGNDTTSMSVCSSIYYLAKYPEMQNTARKEIIKIIGNEVKIPTAEQLKEMKYLNAVIKESLRRYPAPMTYRQLQKPTRLGEYVIPEKSIVRVSNYAVHHDPKHWENAYKFDPERWLVNEKRHQFSYIPFSAGTRNCVGQNFSVMEQRIILTLFLLKYEWNLPEDSIHKEDLVLGNAFLFRPKDLKINFKERKN